MLKFGTRYYMPSLGRWTQRDPEAGKPRNPPSLNPYAYVGADPVNQVDPSGRIFEEWFDDTWFEDHWDCLNPVSNSSLAAAGVGFAYGFAWGTASALPLGPGAVGVGLVSGAAGAVGSYAIAGVLGCGEAYLT
jgi:hypothetical protein